MREKRDAQSRKLVATDGSAVPAPQNMTESLALSRLVGKERQQRQRRTAWVLFLFVGLPTLLATIYFGLIAADRYVSESRLTVRSMQGASPPELSLGAMLGGVASPSAPEAFLIQEYIGSATMLAELQSLIDIRAIYTSGQADWLARLPADASQEDFVEYMTDRITAVYTSDTGVIDLKVQAFTPEDAQTVAIAIVTLTDQMIEGVARRAREDALRFATEDVKRAEQRLDDARQALAAFRNTHGDLNPEQTGGGVMAIITGIETEIARTRTELAVAKSYMRNDSPAVKALNERLKALENQVTREKQRLGNTGTQQTMSDVLAQYDELRTAEEFARAAYLAATASLETARAEVSRKHLYLVPFVEPSLPEDALEPERLLEIFTVFIGSLVIFAILSLMIGAIREHARI